jgi:hypothetical protein
LTHEFVEAIETYFAPFLNGLGFELSPPISISGKHYRATFSRSDRAVVVSYEPGDDYLFIALPTVVSGIQSDLDNRESAPRLSDLTGPAFANTSPAQIQANAAYFVEHDADGPLARKLLMAAKELRICLLHWDHLVRPRGA